MHKQLDVIVGEFIHRVNTNPTTSNYIFHEDDGAVQELAQAIHSSYIALFEKLVGRNEPLVADSDTEYWNKHGRNELRLELRRKIGEIRE